MNVNKINNCNSLNKEIINEMAIKNNIKPSTNKNKTCNDIKKLYKKNNPCTLTIYNDTNLHIKKHQLNIANFLANEQNKGIIVTHGVGTGKTLSAISSAQCLLKNNIVDKVFVITPTSLQHNFKFQMDMYGIENDEDYYFYTINELIQKINNKNTIKNNKSLVIIDEAHNLRTLNGTNFNVIFNFVKKALKVILLTATPLINYNYDIINLIALSSGNEPITIDEFENIIVDSKKTKQYLSNVFSFYIKPANDANFPKRKIHEIFITMDDDYLKLYNKIEKGIIGQFKEFKGKNIQVFYNGVRRASNIIDDTSPKTKWIIKLFKNEPNSKFVIFSHFIEMGINPIIEYLDKKNIKYATITGNTSKNGRQYAVEEYNNNNIKILFISKAGSEGLDLKNTTNIIIMESSWNLNSIEQIIGRGVRYKSHETMPKSKQIVNVYKLLCIKPIEYKNIDKITSNNLLEFDNSILSVDLYLRNFALLKQFDLINFYDLLQKFKI